MNWTQPFCDDCYAAAQPGRIPHRIVEEYRATEKCCSCGRTTRSGVYMRIDPTTVPYPAAEI